MTLETTRDACQALASFLDHFSTGMASYSLVLQELTEQTSTVCEQIGKGDCDPDRGTRLLHELAQQTIRLEEMFAQGQGLAKTMFTLLEALAEINSELHAKIMQASQLLISAPSSPNPSTLQRWRRGA